MLSLPRMRCPHAALFSASLLVLVSLVHAAVDPTSSVAFFNRDSPPHIRAVVYAPARPSVSPPPELPDLYAFSSRHVHKRDVRVLAELGVSHVVLEPYAFHENVPHTHFLTLLHQHNMSVILPFSPSFPYRPASSYDVQDQRPSSLSPIVERFRGFLARYQSHPATAMYVVQPPPVGQSALTAADLRAHLALCRLLIAVRNDECRKRREWCHPLTTELGDAPPLFVTEPLAYLHTLTPALDLFLLRFSQPPSSLASFLTAFMRHQRRAHSLAPLLLVVGADAWDMRGDGAVNGSLQAHRLQRLVADVERAEDKGSSGLIGVVVEDFVDGWWRAAAYDKPMKECGGIIDHEAKLAKRRRTDGVQEVCGWQDMRGRKGDDDGDLFTSVAFMGLTAQDAGSSLQCIQPRVAFFSLMSMWTRRSVVPAEKQATWCDDAGCCVVDEDSGGWTLLLSMVAALVVAILLYAWWRTWQHRRRVSSATRTLIARGMQAESKAHVISAGHFVSAQVCGAVYEAALSLSSSSSTPLSLHHVHVVHALLTSLLCQATARVPSANRALALVHSRMLGSYRAWCDAVHTRPALASSILPATPAALLSDLCAYLLLWTSSEQLRRVPSFVCSAFHQRNTLPFGALLSQASSSIDRYRENYDDLEDRLLQPPSVSPSWSFARLWSSDGAVFAYPLLGGWSALLLAVWPALSFHVLLYIVLLQTLREEDRVEQGLLDLAYHLTGPRGGDTWRLVAVADVFMLAVYQVLSALLTSSFRVKQLLIVLGSVKLLSLFSALTGLPRLLAPVDHVMLLIQLPKLSYVSIYLAVRVLLFFSGSLFRLFTRAKLTALPGHVQHVVELPPAASDQQSASPSVSPASRSSPVHSRPFFKRLGHSLWLLARLLCFWLLVLVSKVLFDLWILMPSVAGLTVTSLCSVPRPPPAQLSPLSLSFAYSYACPLFLASLQSITLLMSLATSYIAYLLWTSVAGALVPRLYDRVNKAERGVLAAGLMLGALTITAALAVGGGGASVGWAVVVVGVGVLLGGVKRRGGWAECSEILVEATRLATAVPASAVEPEQTVSTGHLSSEPVGQGLQSTASDEEEKQDEKVEEAKQAQPQTAVSASPSRDYPASAHGLRHLLQPLFHQHLTLSQALSAWTAILHAMHEEDLLSGFHLSPASPLDPCHPSFLSCPSLSCLLPSVLKRVLFFLRSLTVLRRKHPLRADSVHAMQGVSVVIPMNRETVLYRVDELLHDERVRETTRTGGGQESGDRPVLRLIEFFVEKHAEEWSNLTERIGFTDEEGERSQAAQSNKERRRKNAEALLDTFILLHSLPSTSSAVSICGHTLSSFQPYSDAVVLWCSYRGQTLVRTLRGLSYTRLALLHFAQCEAASSPVEEPRVQLLVAAQHYGVDEQQREEMGRALLLFPWVELVYDHNVRRWQEERVSKRRAERSAGKLANEEQLGPSIKPEYPCCPSLQQNAQLRRSKAAIEKSRHELTSLHQRGVEHMLQTLPGVLDSMRALHGDHREGKAADDHKDVEHEQADEKQADVTVIEQQILRALQSSALLSPSAMEQLLDCDDACSVVWGDVLGEVDGRLHAMQHLELQQCQEELHSEATSHALSPLNILHVLHLHQQRLRQHVDLHAALQSYRGQLVTVLGLHRNMRVASLQLQAIAGDYVEMHAQDKQQRASWPFHQASTELRLRRLNEALEHLDGQLSRCRAMHAQHRAVCEQQRATVLAVMRAMQALLEPKYGREDAAVFPASVSSASRVSALTLSALAQLSDQWQAYSRAMEQLREAQQKQQLLALLHRCLAALPSLLLSEEQHVCRWLQGASLLLPLLSSDGPSAVSSLSYSALLRELHHSSQALSLDLSRLRRLTADGQHSTKAWMRSYMQKAPYSCAIPHPPLPVKQLASHSPLLPALFSLFLSLLHSHSLSALSAAADQLLATPFTSQRPCAMDASVRSLFELLERGSLSHSMMRGIEAVAALQRHFAEIGDGRSSAHARDRAAIESAAASLHRAYLALAIHPFHSVHIKHNTSPSCSSFSPLVLHSLPRHSPLLLGSLPSHLSFAPPTNPKSENQSHALPFTVHPLLQSIDMNQSLTFEDALKSPLFFSSLQYSSSLSPRFVLTGCPEVIYSSNLSAVGSFMAQQDTSFVALCQRVLDYTGARLHYGHPDVFDAAWVRCHVGMSKASSGLNLSEDIFFGLDMMERGEASTYTGWIRYGKGREVSLFNCAVFEDKLSRGAALTLKSRDLFLLSRHLDVLSYSSVVFGGIGHFLYTLLFNYGIVSFVYIVLLMSMARVTSEAIGLLGSVYSIPWLFHLGLLFAMPLLAHDLYEEGMWRGGWRWLSNLLLGSVFYLFQLRTKARGMEVGLAGTSSGYVSTGRGMCLYSSSLVTLYTSYAASHYHHALHLLLLLGVYVLFFSTEEAASIVLRVWAVLLACGSWIVAPALFNPCLHVEWRGREGWGRKWEEWAELQLWTTGESLTGGGSARPPDWESCWWHDKRSALLQHGVRCNVTSDCGWRRYVHHPVPQAVSSVLAGIITHAPLLFLAFALLSSAPELLLPLALYALVIVVVSAVSPSHFLFPLLVFLLAYSSLLAIPSLASSTSGFLLPSTFLIPPSRALSALSVAVAVALVVLVLERLIITAVDACWIGRVHRGEADLNEVPAFYRTVMRGGWAFAVWRAWERRLCPCAIGLVQLACVLLCEWCSDAHSRWMYGVDMHRLRHGRRRREQRVRG